MPFAKGQTFTAINYRQKDGLASDNVYDVCSDKDGFLWFATESGLSRFDGTRFKNYTTKDGLPDNLILKICRGTNGGIWLSTIQNNFYFFEHDSIQRAVILPVKSRIYGYSHIIYEDKQGNAYLSTGKDIIRMDSKGNTIQLSSLVKNLPSSLMYFTIRKERKIITSPDNGIYEIVGDSCRRLLTVNETDVLTGFNKLNKPVIIPNIVHPDFQKIPNDSIYVISSRDTVHFIFTETGRELFYVPQSKNTSAEIDAEGNYWISTEGLGVYKIPAIEIRSYNNAKSPEVFSLIKYRNELWMGHDMSIALIAGNNFIAPKARSFDSFVPISSNASNRIKLHNRLYTLCKGTDDDLLVGSDAFLAVIKKDKVLAKGYAPIKSLAMANDRILMGTGYNAVLLDKKSLACTDTLLNARTIACEYCNNTYYLGTTTGLVVIDAATKKITRKENIPFLNKRITAIKKDSQEVLYIATAQQGLIRYQDGRITEHLTDKKGLLSNICTSLYIDHKNEIWLGTDKGLNHIHYSGKQAIVETLTKEEGLIDNMINALYVDDSMVYAGTPAGLSYFNRNFKPLPSLCRLYIENVTVNGTKLPIDTAYSFKYNVGNIRFEYGVISYRLAANITYQYQLKGSDDSWHKSETPVLLFPSLPPGDYKVIMKAVNRNGIESNKIEIDIHISPPWWKTGWFFISIAIVLGLGILFLYQLRIRQIKKQEKANRDTEYQLSLLEQQALQSQMNPHFIFNCLNSIQQYIFTDNKAAANQYLTGFASLIRQTLDNSARKAIPVSEEIGYLQKYLEMEKVRFGDNFHYNIHVDKTVQADLTEIPPLLLQPYVENCLRHGIVHKKDGTGTIDISFEIHNEMLWCRVKDNGIGRFKATQLKSTRHIEYQSKGMSLTQKRIDLLNKSRSNHITVEVLDSINEEGAVSGTEVIVKFPINT